MGREQLSVIQVITVYVHSRMEKDITVIFRRPIILEQDILYGNFKTPSGNGKVFAGGKSPFSKA